MNPRLRRLLPSLVLGTALAACGSSDGGGTDDSDAATDMDTAGDTVAVDAGDDVAEDTAEDTAPDVAEDTAPDVAEDTAPDVAEDTAPDVAEDTAPDAADIGIDTAPDAADVGIDTAPDAADIGVDTAADAADIGVDTAPDAADVGVDTAPDAADVGIDTASDAADVGVDTPPDAADVGVDTAPDATDAGGDTGETPIGLDARPINATCLAPPRPSSSVGVRTRRAYSTVSFTLPVALLRAPGDDAWWYVVEKGGRFMRFADVASPTAQTVVDLRSIVDAGTSASSETGLLGAAFHPDWATNGEVYFSYNERVSGTYYSVVSRMTFDAASGTIDPDTEERLLRFAQPASNHNGGDLHFGPDGYLYASFGDGGGGGDTFGNGQRADNWFAAILRIDVDDRSDGAYGIPVGNPFADGGGAPEVWAYGLRNPWRFSFDRATGDLWVGDVGQSAREEINIVRAGGNYGWPIYEGELCYGSNPACGVLAAEEPVVTYGRSEGFSVSGGYVYRGTDIAALTGSYVFGDYGSGRTWYVSYDEDGEPVRNLLLDTGLSVAAFGEDVDGELLIVDYGGGGIHRLEPSGGETVTVPQWLSETGCTAPDDIGVPSDGMVPYTVNVPFWSDGAIKYRWFAIPDGTTMTVDGEGNLVLPIGSVVRKDFERAGVRYETRLLVHHDAAGWAGYSYRWLPDGSDAELVVGGLVEEVAGGPWLYPSSAQCLSCHTDAAGRTLGLEVSQLNGLLTYPTGVTANQLQTLSAVGLLDLDASDPEGLARLPSTSDAGVDLTERVYAYFETNCSQCHQPGGPARGSLDLRYEAVGTDLCNAPAELGELGIPGGRIVVGGEPERSVLLSRVSRRDVHGMPPLGSFVADDDGVALIEAWINSGVCDDVPLPETCADGFDDDGDGDVDCEDDDCAAVAACAAPSGCGEATPISIGEEVSGTTVGLSNAQGGLCGSNSGTERVYVLETATTTTVCVSLAGSGYDTYLYARTACNVPGTEVACNDDAVGLQSEIEFMAVSGTSYWLFVDGYNGSGSYTMTVSPGGC